MSKIADRIAEILVTVFEAPRDKIRPDAHLIDDLGADSLDLIEVQMQCEEEFGIEISDEEAAGVLTVADIVQLVDRHLQAGAKRSR